MHKTCPFCKIQKLVSDFGSNVARKDGLQSYCKTCRSSQLKNWYSNNKNLQISRSKKSTAKMEKRNKDYILNYLLNNPCVDCGEKDILVLEFDHVKGKKSFNLSASYRIYSIDNIKQEIEKCQIRCANCHRRVTAIRRNDWKLKHHNAG